MGEGDGELRGELPKNRSYAASRIAGSSVSTGPMSVYPYSASAATLCSMALSRE